MHAFRGQPCDYPVCDRVKNKTFCSAVGGQCVADTPLVSQSLSLSPVRSFAYSPAGGACLHTGTLCCCCCCCCSAFSTNGQDWDISPVIAYTPTQRWEDGSVTTFRARERPHMILDGQSTPIFFLNGVGDPCPGGGGGNTGCPRNGGDHTFTLIVPVGSANSTS